MSLPKSYIAATTSVMNYSLRINYTHIRLYKHLNDGPIIYLLNSRNSNQLEPLFIGLPSKYRKDTERQTDRQTERERNNIFEHNI